MWYTVMVFLSSHRIVSHPHLPGLAKPCPRPLLHLPPLVGCFSLVDAIPHPPVVGRMGGFPSPRYRACTPAKLDQPVFRLTMSITVFLDRPTLRAMRR